MLAALLVLVLLLSFACGQPAMTGAQAAGGPATQLWQGVRIFDAVKRDLETARSRVWVEMYEFGRSDLARDLVARHRDGVDVRVILDPSVAVSRRIGAWLRERGLEARFYPVDERRHQIDHVKLLLTESAALVGGMNWGEHSWRNLDFAVRLTDSALRLRIAAIFGQDWSLAGGKAAPLAERLSAVAQTAPGEEIRYHLDTDLRLVRHVVIAEVFVLTDPQLVAELIQAHRRGVLVEMLLDPNQDVNLPAFNLLRTTGVPVRWFPVPAGAKLHAKAALFDGRLLLGSANWSLSGLSVNHELDVETDDVSAARAFRQRFEADWSRAGAIPW